ncbi:hypothetical protein [Photobacterium damselae]|uniref:hypothetical protein n=1 Tax=Photobacterium damselae TaxID=38293 RepID=UPI000D663F44|nr:hypothetical protein [Photobacterium damselae]AWK84698.1 hypothetical protein BST98_21985 [Photobacterium damselae]
MKSKKFNNRQLATVFISVLGFSSVCFHHMLIECQQTLAPLIGYNNLFFNDPAIKGGPYLLALAIALSVTNVLSKIRNSKKS